MTGDGFDDLAVVYSVDDPADEGEGVVYRGSPTGLTSRLTGGFPGWGVGSVAIGDIGGDGFGDVVAGNAYEDAEDPGGQIYISRGSAGGLAAHRLLGPGTPGMPEAPDGVSGFDSSVTAGDVDADGYGDVAVGLEGAVYILHGGRGGLSAGDTRVLTPETADLSDPYATRFGLDITLIDIDGDAAAELLTTTGESVSLYSSSVAVPPSGSPSAEASSRRGVVRR
ncbi:hypothetical protein [Sphaerisporangium fuscum]|uniref:hypothetical protein n=1 Tax=Sphaerisporangium fuscum TaxID=2835868 RepID=UPI001BDD53F4|nr:hypothetical protein [Sphaerisporangium fuscum]